VDAMRIFLTGATGYIGSAVLEALLRAGHDVTALVRDGEKAALVSERGAHPLVGDLANPASYGQAARGHNAYIHTGLDGSPRRPEIDRLAIETLLAAASSGTAGRGPDSRVFIYTSGVWMLGASHDPLDEAAEVNPTPYSAWRAPHERIVLKASTEFVRTVVVRPGIVYGGARGVVSDFFKDAVNGLIRVMGHGENHWALVYDRDLADLYVRLVANCEVSGIYHATDEGDERVNEIVEAIRAHANVPPDVRHVGVEGTRSRNAYAVALALDQIIRSPRAHALGWTPSLRSVAYNVPRLLEEWRTGQAVSH
jgi:nucleoside-diphosphate-sugar epimerase